jgi:hypothetical protein
MTTSRRLKMGTIFQRPRRTTSRSWSSLWARQLMQNTGSPLTRMAVGLPPPPVMHTKTLCFPGLLRRSSNGVHRLRGALERRARVAQCCGIWLHQHRRMYSEQQRGARSLRRSRSQVLLDSGKETHRIMADHIEQVLTVCV